MNRIYKVIWSKVKHQYVVVSELAHRDGKRSKSIGRSAAALMAVLALTAGIGFLPVQAENVDKGQDNYISGDKNVIHGNSNDVFGDDNAVKGNSNTIHGDNSIIEGNDNWMNPGENNLIKGNNNQISAIDGSKVIGDNVTIVNGKDSSKDDSDRLHSITVIGDDVQIGHFLGDAPGTGSSASAAGDNITVIGDHVQVDNGPNRTNSSNSLIYGNNVNMVNSQNSVAIGNDLSVRGTNDVGDNISIGHDITLGGDNSTASTHSMIAMGNNIQAYGHDNILFGNNIDITDNAGIHGVVVMGTEADATGFDGVAIGTNATSDGNYALAFGGESTATGIAAIAIGKKDVVSASYGTGLGAYATIGSKSDGSTALGSWASVGENSMAAIAIGGAPFLGGAHATIGDDANHSIAIGIGANIADKAQDSIALGTDASVVPEGLANSSFRGVAIGYDATVNGQSGTAIGDTATASGRYSMAMGQGSTVTDAGMYSTAIGVNANAAAAYGIAIGNGAELTKSGTNGMGGIAFGNQAAVDVSQGIAIGSNSNVESNASGSIALGQYATINEGASYSIAIGAAAAQAGNKPPKQPTKIGTDADYSIALGYGASVGDSAQNTLALGKGSSVSNGGSWSIAMGYNAAINNGAQGAMAIGGYQASANALYATALGSSTSVDSAYSTAVGYNSKVTADDIFTADKLAEFKKALGTNYTESYNIKASDISEAGVFSIGSKDSERRLINVARGRIDENSTDAVNGSQLYGLASDLNQKIEKAGGDWNLTTNGGPNEAEKTTVGKGDVVDFSGAKDETTQHQNIQISQEQTTDAEGNVTGTKVSVDLNDRIELGAGDQQIVMDATDGKGILTIGNNVSMSANGAANFGNIQFNSEGQADPQHVSTITGLSNTEWDAANAGKTVAEGGYSDSTRAATEAQLYDAIGSATSSMGWNVTTNGATDNKKAATIKNGAFVDFSGKVDENSANIIVDQNPITDKDGNVVGTNLSFDLNDKIALGTPDVQNNTGIFLDGTTGSATFGGIKVNGESGERTITGLTNTEWDPNTTYNSGRAATEEQLQKAVNQVNADAYNGWKVSANGENDVLVERGDVVDFSSATKTVTRGQETEEHKNITISQDNTDLTFTLNDDLYLGNVNEGTGAYVNVLGSTGQILLGKDATNFINIDGGSRTISGLSNLDWNYNDYQAGKYKDSSLAATESQLHDAFGYLNNKIDSIDISGDDNITVDKPAGTGSGSGGEGGEPTGNGPKFEVGLNDDVTLGTTDDKTGNVTNSGSLTIKDTSGNTITINKKDPVTGKGDGHVSGLTNTDWDWNKYEEDGYQTSNAATESQLHGAMEGTVQYDRDENGKVDKTNVTLNKGGDSVTIHNVAAGVEDTDAVNVSQLKGVEQRVENNSMAITNIGNKVDKLDNRIDEVGAGAAALAALHPLDFDPDDKWDFAAGYGNYRGENAVAIGAFYRPNEDTMFSVGGTVGNGDNMVNAGVSFKLGQGNNVSTSRVAMAKEIKSMRDIVAKQDAQIQKLTAMVNALVGMEAIAPDTTTMFPDVPENHWAYEAVEMMAKTGLVQGYPDGEFKGDRNMTRYEFAQIVYNAIQAGIKVDERLVQEFRPELEYFRIDTISKDKDGNPVIQRVRANEMPVQQ